MKKGDGLYKLIRSMSGTEKGYFKKYAALHVIGKKNEYIRLFDLLASMSTYDESKLRKALEGERILKRLNEAKYYLYRLVLKSLRAYDTGSSADIRITELMHNAKILMRKALHSECANMLALAKKLALATDSHNHMPDIAWWEDKLFFANVKMDAAAEQRSVDIHVTEAEAAKKIDNYAEYKYLSRKLGMQLRKSPVVRTDEERNALSKIMAHPLLRSETKAIGYHSRNWFHHTWMRYYFAAGDYPAALRSVTKSVNLMEEFPEQIRETPFSYMTHLHNLMLQLRPLRRYREHKEILQKLKEFPEKFKVRLKERDEAMWFDFLVTNQFAGHFVEGYFEKAAALVPEIEAGFRKYGNTLKRESLLMHNFRIAHVYFILGEHKPCLQWLNKILNAPNPGAYRQDFQGYARLLLLLVYYETGKQDLIESTLRSVNEFLQNRSKLYKAEKVVLDFFRRQLLQIPDKRASQKMFREFRARLEPVLKDPYESRSVFYFDYLSWADAQINNTSLASAMRQRAKR